MKERMQKLAEEIRYHAKRYYEDDNPEISDEAYDALYRELVELEEKYPELKDPLSPTTRVGGKVLDNLKKVQHRYPQWSFDNIFSYDELKDWEEKILRFLKKEGVEDAKLSYVCELKIDGLKIILDYEDGKLVRAATRGDGRVGEDVTENAKTIKDIPLVIDEKREISVIGEVWIERAIFEKINRDRMDRGEEPYANPRNLAAGTIRQLDTRIVAERKLRSFVYDFNSEEVIREKHEDDLRYLLNLGFSVNTNYIVAGGIEEIQSFYESWVEKRHTMPYGIDGVVIKINEKKYWDILGYTSKAPRFAIAYKFPAEQKTSVLKGVDLQIGRTGVITPVAILEPVSIDGSLVQRATLHNEDEIRRLGLKIGDKVLVEKSGDIIPKIIRNFPRLRTGDEKDISFEEKLKEKGIDAKKIISPSGTTHWYVNNARNDEIQIKRLTYFASKNGLDIEGLAEQTIRLLYERGIVREFSDIFRLRREDLEGLPLFKEKSIENLLNAIEKAKRVNLSSFISALGIPHVGEESADLIAKEFCNPKLLPQLKEEDLKKIHGIGEVLAHSFVSWFRDEENLREYEKLLSLLDIFCDDEKRAPVNDLINPFAGKTVVITGSIENYSRDELKKILKKLGAKVVSQVTKKTDLLILGEKPGSKLEKAKELGVEIMDAENLLSFLAGSSS